MTVIVLSLSAFCVDVVDVGCGRYDLLRGRYGRDRFALRGRYRRFSVIY